MDSIGLFECKPGSSLNRAERFFIADFDCMLPNGYNMTEGGESPSPAFTYKGKTHSAETRRKLSISIKKVANTEAFKRRVSEVHTGKVNSVETRLKMSKAKKGVKFSAEHRAKIGAAGRGRKQSAETIRKRSEALRGQKRSAESRRKMSEAQKGRKFTEEHKRKLSEAGKRRAAANPMADEMKQRISRKLVEHHRQKIPSTAPV